MAQSARVAARDLRRALAARSRSTPAPTRRSARSGTRPSSWRVLLLLEKLTPTERAAYVLRESFGYPYAEIADILQLSQANVRQLVSRARKHLAGERREPVAPGSHRRLLEAFVRAAQTGDVVALERLLADDVVSCSDGNGVRGVARIPVVGPEPGRPVRRRASGRASGPAPDRVGRGERRVRPLLISVDGSAARRC